MPTSVRGARPNSSASGDEGETWSTPEVIRDSPLDDRDTGIVETKQGTLLVSWFTSVAFEKNADYHQHAISSGSDAKAVAYSEISYKEQSVWGVGIHQNTVIAGLESVINGINRLSI